MATVRMHRDPALGEPHTADVHPDEVSKWEARGWVVGEGPPPEGNTITGLSNVAWDPANVRDDRAATEGQLAALALGGGAAVDLSGFAKKAEMESALSGKVDKVGGMGLSTVDYTVADAAKLAALPGLKSIGPGLNLDAAGELSATGGGTGTGVDWADVTNKPNNLATTDDVDAKAFIATYNVTTAQEIIAYINAAKEPFAPLLVKRGNDYYTVTTAQKQAENKVIIRTFATLSGEYYMFTYTITNGTWANANHGFQKLLVSGADIKTINGESLLGSGDIVISGGSGQAFTREYLLCVEDVGGNVVRIGEIEIDNTDYGIFEFYYRTPELPNAATAVYSFATLLANYTIKDFIAATGVTSNGVFIGNGRTDNDNRLIVQQFSKNNKNMTIRSYSDFHTATATLQVRFIGTKTS